MQRAFSSVPSRRAALSLCAAQPQHQIALRAASFVARPGVAFGGTGSGTGSGTGQPSAKWASPVSSATLFTSQRRFAASSRQYAKSHEYLWSDSTSSPASVKIGITKHAVGLLGEVVFVELPDVGTKLTVGEAFCQIESVKAVGDVYAPVDGEVTEVNEAIKETPTAVNTDPEVEGWFVKIKVKDGAASGGLLNEEEYKLHCQAEQ
eukprot:Selendium_serpulae@DN5932_c0_g1_i1.p1